LRKSCGKKEGGFHERAFFCKTKIWKSLAKPGEKKQSTQKVKIKIKVLKGLRKRGKRGEESELPQEKGDSGLH